VTAAALRLSKLWQYGKHPSEIMPDLLQYSTITVADLDAIEIYFGIKTDKNESDENRFQKTFKLLKVKINSGGERAFTNGSKSHTR